MTVLTISKDIFEYHDVMRCLWMKPALKGLSTGLGRQAPCSKYHPKLLSLSLKEAVKTGIDVIAEGDLNASFFYIVKPVLPDKACQFPSVTVISACERWSGQEGLTSSRRGLRGSLWCCPGRFQQAKLVLANLVPPRKEHRRWPNSELHSIATSDTAFLF